LILSGLFLPSAFNFSIKEACWSSISSSASATQYTFSILSKASTNASHNLVISIPSTPSFFDKSWTLLSKPRWMAIVAPPSRALDISDHGSSPQSAGRRRITLGFPAPSRLVFESISSPWMRRKHSSHSPECPSPIDKPFACHLSSRERLQLVATSLPCQERMSSDASCTRFPERDSLYPAAIF